MSAYDPYDGSIRERERDRDHSRRYYTSDRDRRERAEPRYADVQESYYRANLSNRTELVPRAREDSDLSVEEIRRDFPPPGSPRDIRRTRSAEPGHDEYYYDHRRQYDAARDRDRDRAYRPHKKPGSVYYEEEERTRKRVLSKQDKIIAAVVGGVVAAGAKELWDRHEAKEEGGEIHRNIAASAALGAAGAFAGYQGADLYNKHATATKEGDKKSTYVIHKGRDGRVIEYYSDDEEDPRGQKSNRSFLESALSAAGLGGAIKALTGGGSDKDDRRSDKDDRRSDKDDRRSDKDDRRSDARSRRSSPDSRRSRSKSQDTPAARMQKAAKASLVAGAAEAFRVSKEPGDWRGEKMKRVLTAAAGAAAVDAARDPSRDSKHHLLESVIGGLVGNRMLHGSRKDIEEDARTGRSRSRSRARSDGGGSSKGGLAALATAGLGALGAKKILDRSRSRSRSRRGSPDSYNSRDRSPRKNRSRSRSIVDGARRSLAKIGIGSGPEDSRDDDYYDDHSSRRSRHRSPDDDDDYTSRGYMRGGRGDDHRDDRSAGSRRRSRSAQRGGRSSVSNSDLGDSEDDEKMARKMKGKQLLKAGLAAVATIHAVHGVYDSMGARNARHKAVKEDRLSPAEVKKLKTKAILKDAATVGIAAFTIQGAVQELKEAQDQTKQFKEWQQEKRKRHERRTERLKRANSNHYGRSRADNWSASAPAQSRRYDGDGPRYTDGSPYLAALPAPPIGYEER